MVFSKQYDIIHSVDTEERQVLMGSKVTFDDIAAYTHFSKTTISRYFNNPESVTLQNRKIISDALEALNYKNMDCIKIRTAHHIDVQSVFMLEKRYLLH